MPIYVIEGKKVLRDGSEHVIRETAPSMVKADWIRAQYVEAGYTVIINTQEQ